MKSRQTRGNLLIFIAAVFWSLGGVFIKSLPWNPIMINGVRSFFALVVFMAYRKGKSISFNKYTVTAGFTLALVNIINVFANQMTTAANAIMLQYLAPIIVLLYVCVYTKRLPFKYEIGSIMIAIIGIIVFFGGGFTAGNQQGDILAIVNAFIFAFFFFINSLPETKSEDSIMIGMIISVIVMLVGNFDYRSMTSSSLIIGIFMGVIQLGLPYIIFAKGISMTTAISGSLISVFEAVLSPVWVLIVVHERPSMNSIVGGGIVLISVLFYSIMNERTHFDVEQ